MIEENDQLRINVEIIQRYYDQLEEENKKLKSIVKGKKDKKLGIGTLFNK